MGDGKNTHGPGWSSDCLEQAVVHSMEEAPAGPELVLDSNGYPLRPQPSSDPQDPLNWNKWYKLAVLLQVSFLAFLGPFSQGAINAGFLPLSEYLDRSITSTSYTTTLAIVFAGIAPIFWSPIANVYGRRCIYIFVSVIGIAAGVGCALATSYGPLLVARIFVGIGTSPGMGIGASVVADLYYMHERGRYMGIYIVFVTNGAHVASFVGGFVATYAGWRWCYWIPTIALGATWLVNLAFLPETLYHRDLASGRSLESKSTWYGRLALWKANGDGRLRAADFLHCFQMLRYPSVLFIGAYYSYAFGIGTVLFAVTGAAAFGSVYEFNSAQVGMAIGFSTLIGSIIGEFASGPVSDTLVLAYRKRHEGVWCPEVRLHAMWPGLVILPAGVIIEGVCLQYNTHWIGPVIGIGIGAFGLQVVSTNSFAYLADCYRPQSAEISTLLNFGRLTFSFTLGFYMIPFAEATSFGIAWAVMAVISMVLYGGVILLLLKGRQWREALGTPQFDIQLWREG